MFCPVCKSEYRDGFTKCSDCGVDLVKQLADDSEAMEALWAGQDASVRGAICDKLDAAKILHEDDSVDSQLMPAFRQSIFRIQIRKKDHEAALQAILDVPLTDSDSYLRKSPGFVLDRNSDLLSATRAKRDLSGRMIAHDPESPELDSRSEIPTNAPIPRHEDLPAEEVPDDQLENFNPDDATSQVWSGPDREMASSVVACLREVGIGSVIDRSNASFSVQVEPATEARAKEIVREIIEQTPPE